jgi:hypothetical protein
VNHTMIPIRTMPTNTQPAAAMVVILQPPSSDEIQLRSGSYGMTYPFV